jgi:vesicle transport through interaction with t-SNAREs protein 1
MTTLLQSYDDEYQDVVRQLRTAMAELRNTCSRDAPSYSPPPATGPLSRVQRVKACDMLLSKCRELTSSIEVEMNDAIPAQRTLWKEKSAGYKQALFESEKDLTRLKRDASAADRDDLLKKSAGDDIDPLTGEPNQMGNANGGLDAETLRQRTEMASNTNKLQEGTKTLRVAERILADTERLGEDTSRELVKQREVLVNIGQTTAEIDGEVSEARRIVNQMHKVMIQNKAILVGIICVLAGMILVIIYVKTSGDSTDSSTTAPTVVVLPPPAGTSSGDGGLGS